MLGIEIRNIIEAKFPELVPYFEGIFAFDECPSSLKEGHFAVINRSSSEDEGTHWFLLMKNCGIIEMFDSLGLSDDDRWTSVKVKGPLQFNRSRVQSPSSSACGGFVTFFACFRNHNLDMTFEEALNECFSSDLSANEEKVKRFLKSWELE